METLAEAEPPSKALLGPDDPRPVESYNQGGRLPALVVCDHASAFIPPALANLGLDESQLARHIALDIGAAEVARLLADRLGAPALLSRFSRLIVDPNRTLDSEGLIPAVSDGVPVPGNRDLLPAAREARIETFHQAYHGAISEKLDALVREAGSPDRVAVISVHSFTPVMDGAERPWQIGILWNRDERLPRPLMAKLRALGLTVGDNQPYSGRNKQGYTLHRHAEPYGIPNVLIEIRQDLIDTRQGAAEWAELLAGPLREVLSGMLSDGAAAGSREPSGRPPEEPIEGGRL